MNIDNIINYYRENGYSSTLEYIKDLNINGKISLNERAILQNLVTDMYTEPTKRSQVRKILKYIKKSIKK